MNRDFVHAVIGGLCTCDDWRDFRMPVTTAHLPNNPVNMTKVGQYSRIMGAVSLAIRAYER